MSLPVGGGWRCLAILSSARLVYGHGIGVEVRAAAPYVLLLRVELQGFGFVHLDGIDLSLFGVRPLACGILCCIDFRPVVLIN